MRKMARFWRDLPLSNKLTCLTSLLVLGVVCALTYLTVHRERASFRQELESQANLLLETLPLTMRDQLYRLELDELADIAKVVSSNENVVLFIVYDRKGAVLVDAAQTALAFAQEIDPVGARLISSAQHNPGQDEIYLDWERDRLVASRAISLGNQPIGAISLGLSTAPLREKITALAVQSAGLALVTLLVGGGLAFLSARQITNPLHELTVVAAQMADGNLMTRVTVRSQAEVGQLGRAFNRMADAIQLRETELRELAEGLERTVAERTAELRAQNDALIAARQQAEAANRIKGAFLAMMSHEIRTPINAILGFAQLMASDTTLSGETREDLDIIIRSGEYLLTIINQVLDLSKIEAGRLTLNERAFDLYYLLDDLENLFRLRAADKQLQLVFTRAADVPQHIRTDEVKLRQVLINLLNNALKFTTEGGVAVRVSKNEDEDVLRLHFAVEDTGPGIAPDELDTIFEAFVQTRTGRAAQEGTGLGLPISRKFVELLGGELTVASELERGATFKFAIACTLADVSEVSAEGATRRVVALAPQQPRYRILIADDHKTNRQLLIKMLSPLGFELREASNGQEALGVWENWQPHLIWMDVSMPILNGYKTTAYIRDACARDAARRAPIIVALTASTLLGDEDKFRAAGYDDFLRKPFRAAEVFELMGRRLGVQYVYREAITEASDSAPRGGAEGAVLTAEMLAAVPAEILRDLEQATVRSQFNQIMQISARLREYDAAAAVALDKLLEDFAYSEILEVVREAQQRAIEPQLPAS